MDRFLKRMRSDSKTINVAEEETASKRPSCSPTAPAKEPCRAGRIPARLREKLTPRDGDWYLTSCCKIFLSRLSDSQLKRLVGNMSYHGKMLTAISMCSGSEIAYMNLHIVQDVTGVGRTRHLSSCDIDERKRNFCNYVVTKLEEDWDGCIFTDICDLSSLTAPCCRHKKHCRVMAATLGSCGFSCKNFSKLFLLSRSRTDWMQTATGSSGVTCHGMLAYLLAHPNAIFFSPQALPPKKRLARFCVTFVKIMP